MNTITKLLGIGWLSIAMLSPSILANPSKPPNILVILLDDAGYNDFGFMGSANIKTPNIDKLAASGIRFMDAHLSGTTCSPSRAGLMTGRYQQRFGHEENVPPLGKGMDPAEKTIGDAFQQIGYRTIYIGKWHLGSTDEYYPTNRGWDEFYGLREGHRDYFYQGESERLGNHKSIEHNNKHVKWDGYVTDHFTDVSIDYLERNQEDPFFMFLSYTAPHAPMQAKEEHLEKFKNHPRQKLAAMIWSVDEGIGRVLAKLEELNLRDDTLIFFLSDNGGAVANQSNNKPLKGYKGDKFEGGQRTPFIVSWPSELPAGDIYDGLVSALDIYPTAAVAAGAPLDIGKPLDGVDLMPYLTGQKEGDPHGFLFWHRNVENAARMGDYKLIGHEEHGWRLYNLKEDIGETRDLSKSHPEVMQQMKQALAGWVKDLGKPQWPPNPQWKKVKSEIYRAMMDNDAPRYTSPRSMRRYHEKHEARE